MVRLLFKAIFGIIVIALAIYGGICAYIQLRTIENIQNTDIFEAIPANPDMMLIVHSPKQLIEKWNILENFFDLLPEKESLSVIDAIGKAQVCNEQCIDKETLAMAYYPEGNLLFLRMKKHDFNYMEQTFLSENLSAFAPKEESYRDAKIYIKATCGEGFFCYTLYHHIFIGSFEKRLVHKAIDAFTDKKSINPDSLFFDKNAFAGLYLNYQRRFPVFKMLNPDTLNYHITGNVQLKDQVLEISGFLPVNSLDTVDLADVDSIVSLDFNPEMIPLNTDSFSLVLDEKGRILFNDEEALKKYTEQIDNQQSLEQDQAFQTLFRQYYDEDVREISWTQQQISSTPYNFLMLSSPNQTDKFYNLLIYREP